MPNDQVPEGREDGEIRRPLTSEEAEKYREEVQSRLLRNEFKNTKKAEKRGRVSKRVAAGVIIGGFVVVMAIISAIVRDFPSADSSRPSFEIGVGADGGERFGLSERERRALVVNVTSERERAWDEVLLIEPQTHTDRFQELFDERADAYRHAVLEEAGITIDEYVEIFVESIEESWPLD